VAEAGVVGGGAKKGEREVGRGKEKKIGEEMIFLPTSHPNFSSFKSRNPPLFIDGGREIFCF
jgi:hypothetical protein